MKIGYARVSTHEQSLDMQLDSLANAGCEKIYSEKVSSGKAERIELNKVLEYLRSGDTLIVYKLDRLARSLKELLNINANLKEKGINFISITENINISTPTGELFLNILGSIAQFEREMIKERTLEGIKSARARGRVGGRPPKLTLVQKQMIRELHKDKNNKNKQIMEQFNIKKTLFYQVIAS